MIKFKQSFDFKRMSEEMQARLKPEFEAALMDEASEIIERTQRGQQIDEKPFVKYSKGYLSRKLNAGRNAKPDLTFTGNMLQSITSRVKAVGDKLVGEIFFASTKEARKAGFNQERRPFFGFSEKQIARLRERMKKVLGK